MANQLKWVWVAALCACGAKEAPGLSGGPGPWPTQPLTHFSSVYGLGDDLLAVGSDEGHNLWLLDGSHRLGVLPAGATAPTWTRGLGQAGRGFTASAVCGGASGQAYVGYLAAEPNPTFRAQPFRLDEPSEGDVDVVALESGGIGLTRHLSLFNSNDHHYNEVSAILTCARVVRGPSRGDVYVGSNHAVTRIRGLDYSDHRHPVWSDQGSLRVGYHRAVAIGQEGQVLIGNDWKVALLAPPPALEGWIDYQANPWKLDTYVPQLNSLEAFDHWEAAAQTREGTFYFASRDDGLWSLPANYGSPSTTAFTKVSGLPTGALTALAATDDGALFIGTQSSGLWRRERDGRLARVNDVTGDQVRQLVYDPSVEPPLLLVLTNAGLFGLRGP